MSLSRKSGSFTRSAELAWSGDVVRGSGSVTSGANAFDLPVRFPSLRGEPAGTTSPEELLAAAHAACFGIGLRSVIARRGASASRVTVRATITAEKGAEGIRIRRSHLDVVIEGLTGLEERQLDEIGATVKRECTISQAIRGSVAITTHIRTS
ncbi:MAG TPA: OsmC family peroxiredoxin [Longimicrobiales bacterium]|nr:OsmC family peroxiredoxin [Longimicrobiales bacterium]